MSVATAEPGPIDPRPTAERFIGTLLREWAYARSYRSNTERLEALPIFVDFYNQVRPHRALGGLSPAVVVNNVRGDDS